MVIYLLSFSSFSFFSFFFFNDTATTEIYTLSLHDALPISATRSRDGWPRREAPGTGRAPRRRRTDRKSTRLNSSHEWISYAVFCLKKKKKKKKKTKKNNNKKKKIIHIKNEREILDNESIRR